jgi:hypothetical protein
VSAVRTSVLTLQLKTRHTIVYHVDDDPLSPRYCLVIQRRRLAVCHTTPSRPAADAACDKPAPAAASIALRPREQGRSSTPWAAATDFQATSPLRDPR